MAVKLLMILALVGVTLAQRPTYAGSRPIGYPAVVNSTPANAEAEGLGNKFGTEDTSTTTQRLPLEALGDRDLVNRISKLPIDKQPFWFINWKALEAHRKNPQTWPQKPNDFTNNHN